MGLTIEQRLVYNEARFASQETKVLNLQKQIELQQTEINRMQKKLDLIDTKKIAHSLDRLALKANSLTNMFGVQVQKWAVITGLTWLKSRTLDARDLVASGDFEDDFWMCESGMPRSMQLKEWEKKINNYQFKR